MQFSLQETDTVSLFVDSEEVDTVSLCSRVKYTKQFSLSEINTVPLCS